MNQPVPATVRWIPDAEVSVCSSCELLFDWMHRKHHCRYVRFSSLRLAVKMSLTVDVATFFVCSYCGHVSCELCTLHRSLIPANQILSGSECKYLAVNAHNPQRVCDKCYARLEPQQEELRASLSIAHYGYLLMVLSLGRLLAVLRCRVFILCVCVRAGFRYHDEPRCARDGREGVECTTTCE